MQALTSSQRLTGLILSIYPLFLLGLFFLIALRRRSALHGRDRENIAGHSSVPQLIGVITIRRITNLDV
jgi:hypothetical protein